jgi:hypothetical protein
MQTAKIEKAPEPVQTDVDWSAENLRRQDGRILTDLANCLRVLERHPDYKGRFRFNEMLNKVVDRGAVMVEWRINEIATEIQERFIPDVAPENVARALVIAANRFSPK